jgi:hypothetical protein
MGRVTYEEMTPYRPSATGPITERMNTLPKLVFSRTRSEPLGWANANLATAELADEVTALKQQSRDEGKFFLDRSSSFPPPEVRDFVSGLFKEWLEGSGFRGLDPFFDESSARWATWAWQ